ncbi:MAG: polysaccharide deacetylase family protein [Clostridia bacterium]|nr:polysaccharide deacetylase family protein [Clostridia bacterium]
MKRLFLLILSLVLLLGGCAGNDPRQNAHMSQEASETPSGTTATETVGTTPVPTKPTVTAPTQTTGETTATKPTTVTPTETDTPTPLFADAADFAEVCRTYATETLLPLCTAHSDGIERFLEQFSGDTGNLFAVDATPAPYYTEYNVQSHGDGLDFEQRTAVSFGLFGFTVDLYVNRDAGAPLPALLDFASFPILIGFPYEEGGVTLTTEENAVIFTYNGPETDGYTDHAQFRFVLDENGAPESAFFRAQHLQSAPKTAAEGFAGVCLGFVSTVRAMTATKEALEDFLCGCGNKAYTGTLLEEDDGTAVRRFRDGGISDYLEILQTWQKDGKKKTLTLTVRGDTLQPPLPDELDFYAFPDIEGLPFREENDLYRQELYTADGALIYSYRGVGRDEETNVRVLWTFENGHPASVTLSAALETLSLPYEPFTPEEKTVAFTFDDGPDYWTSGVLDVLEEGDKVSFFITGYMIDRYPEIRAAYVRRALDMGCDVGIHCYDHEHNVYVTSEKRDASPEVYEREIERLDEKYRALFGCAPQLWRPMGGNFNPKRAYPYAEILWSVDSYDWKTFSEYLKKGLLDKDEHLMPEVAEKATDEIAERILSQVRPGDIVLMHDIYETSALAFAKVYRALKADGWRFVTVSELLEIDPAAHHGQYFYSTRFWGENGKTEKLK